MQHNLIKNAVANGKQFRKTQLEFITSRLAGISKALHDKNLSVCPFNSICKQEESQICHVISDPLPNVLTLNINWFCQQVPYMDTLQFYACIPSRFCLSDLYEIENNHKTGPSEKDTGTDKTPEYILKSVVCFLGNHYMTYIKKHLSDGTPVWKLYNDSYANEIFASWNNVVESMLELGILPTLLIYDKLS